MNRGLKASTSRYARAAVHRVSAQYDIWLHLRTFVIVRVNSALSLNYDSVHHRHVAGSKPCKSKLSWFGSSDVCHIEG